MYAVQSVIYPRVQSTQWRSLILDAYANEITIMIESIMEEYDV